ncbi:MAG: FAD-binding oxidoreductase [Planctomycetes bacterium]|nr:FAD-binding oxidoreductase [Planctomycetota bacterium]
MTLPTPTAPDRRRRIRRLAVLLPASLLVLGLLRPVLFLAWCALGDRDTREPPPAGHADDVSRLNATPVAEVLHVPAERAEAERALADALRRARAGGRKVAIAGARHSMGGQTLYPDAIVLDMRALRGMRLDDATKLLTVETGALWSEVLPYLNARGRSVSVMQSFDSFTVGGTLSVNGHGWQPNRPPMSCSVHAFRLLRADGSIVRCTPAENGELFSLALGGYGLFGVLLDVELETVPDERYRAERMELPSDRYASTFAEKVGRASDAGLAYGRLNVSPDRFLRDAVLTVYRRVPTGGGGEGGGGGGGGGGPPGPLADPEIPWLKRAVLLGSAGSDYGKALRWSLETRFERFLVSEVATRNQLLHEGVAIYENRSASTTDILHEYFLPPERFESFLEALRRLVPPHRSEGLDLLNVTVRDLQRDDVSFLRYADRDLFAFVLLWRYARTPAADAAMERMTRELLDAVLALGGRYYLPYRLHATPAQLRTAYPQVDAFFRAKRRYDPDELFQNLFYLQYGAEPR